VSAIVVSKGLQIAGTPLVDWLQAACTHIMANQAPTEASPIVQMPLGAPVMDANLLHHQWEFVARDLPALDPAQIQHGAQHIATTIGQLTTEQCITCKEAAQA